MPQRHTRADFRLAFDQAPVGLAHVDLDGRWLHINQRLCNILAYQVDDLVGHLVLDVTYDADRADYTRCLDQLLQQESETNTVMYPRFIARDGRNIPTHVLVFLVRERGTPKHFSLVVNIMAQHTHEQDEQRAAEIRRQADQLQSKFIAGLSHELRTPLHHIKGYASTLLRRSKQFDAQTTQEYLEVISDESDKLARLIVDLLQASKIENGTLSLDVDTVLIDELTSQVIQRWQGVEQHYFDIMLPNMVTPIPADAACIEQVLDSLLSNVVRHTPPQTRTRITFQVTREEVVVAISDQGPGIALEHIPYVFDRFYKGGTPEERRHGNGLGLYIARGIVEQHGGRIWVEMSPGSGTTFMFSLPRRRGLTTARKHQ